MVLSGDIMSWPSFLITVAGAYDFHGVNFKYH